jgi:hypothetical protein
MKTAAKPEIRIEPKKGERGSATVLPFMFVAADAVVAHGQKQYRILIYGAYNAYGLIGPEQNGIAVLDESSKQVVADRERPASSGYFGPTQNQIALWRKLVEADEEEFRNTVNSFSRLRYEI